MKYSRSDAGVTTELADREAPTLGPATQLKRALGSMTYEAQLSAVSPSHPLPLSADSAFGAAALQPIQMKEADGKPKGPPRYAGVISFSEEEDDNGKNVRFNALIAKGRVHGVTVGLRATIGGIPGKVIKVYPTRAKVRLVQKPDTTSKRCFFPTAADDEAAEKEQKKEQDREYDDRR